MKLVARRRLGYLVEEGVSVEKHDSSHRRTSLQLPPEDRRLHSEPGSGNLDINARGRTSISEQERQSHDTFIADRSDLGRVVIGHGVHERADAALYEIDKRNGFVGPIQRLAVAQRDALQMRPEAAIVLWRQQPKQSI